MNLNHNFKKRKTRFLMKEEQIFKKHLIKRHKNKKNNNKLQRNKNNKFYKKKMLLYTKLKLAPIR